MWIAYGTIMSLIAFVVMAIDKNSAIKQKRRISERTLFLLALLGGSVGIYFGMYAFRHKTKHLRFTFGIPLIIIGQISIIAFLVAY